MEQMGKALYIALNNLMMGRRSACTCSKARFHHSHIVPPKITCMYFPKRVMRCVCKCNFFIPKVCHWYGDLSVYIQAVVICYAGRSTAGSLCNCFYEYVCSALCSTTLHFSAMCKLWPPLACRAILAVHVLDQKLIPNPVFILNVTSYSI